MTSEVDLIVPMKPPRSGKSRLRAETAAVTSDREHERLVLALARDTLSAARRARGVRTLMVVTAEPGSLDGLSDMDVELLDENGAGELNSALLRAERVLRARDPDSIVGAMQADLPALRPEELAAAIGEARGNRAFVADRHGSGTTLLLSGRGAALRPRFGAGSARTHTASGALRLQLAAASLRADVDTGADLTHAAELGLGSDSAARLGHVCMVSSNGHGTEQWVP